MKAISFWAGWLVMLFCSAMFSGFAIATMWDWFVVPSFDLPGLSLPAAYGMGILAAYVSMPTSASDIATVKQLHPSATGQAGYYLGQAVGRSVLALIFGFLASRFM
jgi:hypothetical protein